mmetsp:Transcript_23325/g.43315  ORF Transcript_23325/g.43315 Transcript_23325/m.43315 type:complete len:95 (-) Transcript_23325:701-985(-)
MEDKPEAQPTPEGHNLQDRSYIAVPKWLEDGHGKTIDRPEISIQFPYDSGGAKNRFQIVTSTREQPSRKDEEQGHSENGQAHRTLEMFVGVVYE